MPSMLAHCVTERGAGTNRKACGRSNFSSMEDMSMKCSRQFSKVTSCHCGESTKRSTSPKTTTAPLLRGRFLVVFKLLSAFVRSDFFKCLRLNLANSLAGYAKLFPHFLKRVVNTIFKAVAHFKNFSLFR